MKRYLVKSEHTPEECLKDLDGILAKGTDLLEKFDWGCMTGTHAGWAIVEGKDESSVRKMIPESMRDKARITEVGKITPEQIKAYHES